MQLTNIKKILLIKLRSLGDLITITPCTRAIKEAFPESRLSVMVQEGLEEVMTENPFVDKVIIYHPQEGFFRQLSFIFQIKRDKYDFVINLHGGPRSAVYTFFSGARHRLGGRQKKDFFNWIYNIRIRPWNELLKDGKGHCVEQLLASLKCAGIHAKNSELVFRVSRKNEEYVHNLLKENNIFPADKVIVIHPCTKIYRLPVAKSSAKSWAKEKFADLADRLISDYKIKVIMTGTQNEKKFINEIKGLMKYPVLDLSGKTTVGQLAALYKRAALFLGLDSGPTHLAAAAGTNIVVLYGPTNAQGWHPWISKDKYTLIQKKLPCIACGQTICPLYDKPLCMESVSVAEVVEAINLMLRNFKVPPLIF